MAKLYFEDFHPGQKIETASYTVSEEEIIEFARKYDYQSFHTDPEAARQSIYGGLIASGFQQMALTFRLFLDTGVLDAGSMGSPGMDEVRWLKPLRPGDTIRVVVEILETRESRSKPDRGIVRLRYNTLNQDGETIMTMLSAGLMRKRPTTAK